jgi:hypothetical protein
MWSKLIFKIILQIPTTTDLQKYHHHNTTQLLPPPCPHYNHIPKITSMSPNRTPSFPLQNRKHQTPTAKNTKFSTSNHLIATTYHLTRHPDIDNATPQPHPSLEIQASLATRSTFPIGHQTLQRYINWIQTPTSFEIILTG